MTFEVFVPHGALEHVGDGLESAMRVVGKSGGRRDGKLVEHKERVEVAQLAAADGATDGSTGTLRLLTRQDGLDNSTGDFVSVHCGERGYSYLGGSALRGGGGYFIGE